MKLQVRLQNNSWIDDDRIDMFIGMILTREVWLAPRQNREPMITGEQVIDLLATGVSIRYDDDWFAYIRDADAQPKPQPRQPDYPDGRKLSCGHTVYFSAEIMNASLGSSCSECYDRLSG